MYKGDNFFDKVAKDWDRMSSHRNIKEIIELINIKEGEKILDVACGTGILLNYFLEYNPSELVLVDSSFNMIEIAKKKCDLDKVKYINDDVFNLFENGFDKIVIFNAFPHFLEKEKLLKHLKSLLKENGEIIICHNFGRKEIDKIHEGVPKDISSKLIRGKELISLVKDFLSEKNIIDNGDIYFVSFIKKK